MRLANILWISVLLCSCARIEPTHPFDSDTPLELRAYASFVGQFETFDQNISDFSSLNAVLTSTQDESQKVVAVTESGAFRFDEIFAGNYILTVRGSINDIEYQVGSLGQASISLDSGLTFTPQTPFILREVGGAQF